MFSVIKKNGFISLPEQLEKLRMFSVGELELNESSVVLGLWNIKRSRVWRALFLFQLTVPHKVKSLTCAEISLLARYTECDDSILNGMANEILNNVEPLENAVSDKDRLNKLLQSTVALTPDELGVFQTLVLKCGVHDDGDVIAMYILQQLKNVKNIISDDSRSADYVELESDCAQRNGWKMFKHLATLLGQIPGCYKVTNLDEIFNFFFNEFTAGFYRHEFELTRDSKGFGTFVRNVLKYEQGELVQSWIDRTFWLLAHDNEEFQIETIPTFNSASLPHLFWAFANADNNLAELVTTREILLAILKENNSLSPKSILLQIHIRNILAEVFRAVNPAKFTSLYDATLSMALDGFSVDFSSDKNATFVIRNASLKLFGRIMQQLFGPKYNVKMSIQTFSLRYPIVYATMTNRIKSSSKIYDLYPVLLILRQLYATVGSSDEDLQSLQACLVTLLAHQDWKCRCLAAEVLVAVNHDYPKVLFDKLLQEIDYTNQNRLHGTFVAVDYLLAKTGVDVSIPHLEVFKFNLPARTLLIKTICSRGKWRNKVSTAAGCMKLIQFDKHKIGWKSYLHHLTNLLATISDFNTIEELLLTLRGNEEVIIDILRERDVAGCINNHVWQELLTRNLNTFDLIPQPLDTHSLTYFSTYLKGILRSTHCMDNIKIKRAVDHALDTVRDNDDVGVKIISEILLEFIKIACEPHVDLPLRQIAADIAIRLLPTYSVISYWTSVIMLAQDECEEIRRRIRPLIEGVQECDEIFITAVRMFTIYDQYTFLSDMYPKKNVEEVIEMNSEFEINFIEMLQNKYHRA